MNPASRPHIVIVGAGFGGIETALYLRRRLGDQVRLTLLSDRDLFVFRPYLTYVPFGLVPERITLDVHDLARKHDLEFVVHRVQTLRPDERRLVFGHGATLAYDYLVLATGARMGADEVLGLEAHALLLWREHDLTLMRGTFERLAHTPADPTTRVAFVVPPGSQWAGPVYEMAFMLDQWLTWQEARARVEIVLYTKEHRLMDALGDALDAELRAAFSRARIAVHTDVHLTHVEDDALHFQDDTAAPYDVLITAPTYTASVAWHPLPLDARGFIKARLATRQVEGHDAIYAVGDASSFPVKQAFLALLQADAAAEHLAARILGTEPDFTFEPTTLWVMEQFNQALLAQVPLPDDDAEPAQSHLETIPPGPHRRLALHNYLRWSSQGSNPLYAGLLWKGTQIGLHSLAQLTKR